jgi:thiol-disulfide isomerase/thioredoxin
MKQFVWMTLAASMVVTVNVAAQDDDAPVPIFSVGDTAPALEISHWVKGDAIEEFEDGHVYVVEHWATWCGPCVMGMPHLSELQEKHEGDVTIIGVSNEPLQKVVGFLFQKSRSDQKIHNERSHYTVAADPDQSVWNAYLRAAKQSGIPTAFIVGKDQAIEWIGHPSRMDEVLAAVVDDTWDRETYAADFKVEQEKKAAQRKVATAMRDATKQGDWGGVLKVVNTQLADDPNDVYYLSMKWKLLVSQLDRPKEGYAVARHLLGQIWDSSGQLNSLAWSIADDSDIKTRDIDLALKAGLRGAELDPDNAAIFDTVARCYFEQGNLTKAIEFQKEAVAKLASEEGGMADDIRATLESYEAHVNDV